MNSKSKVSPIIFAASVLAFLLPFITVSCGGQRVASFSGVQLAAGTTVEQQQMFGPPQKQRIDPEPAAAIAAFCAIAGFLLSFPGMKTAMASCISGAVGAVSLFVMKSRVDDAFVKKGQGLLQVNYEIGFNLTLLLLIGAAVWNAYVFSQRHAIATVPLPVAVPPSPLRSGPVITDPVQVLDYDASPPSEKKCPQCGAQWSDDARFCEECGRPATSDAPTTRA